MAQVLFVHQIWDTPVTDYNRKSLRFFKRDLYKKVYITSLAQDHEKGITTENFPELRLWLIRNCTGEVLIDLGDNRGYGSLYSLWFSDDEDLVKFKMSPWADQALEWIDK